MRAELQNQQGLAQNLALININFGCLMLLDLVILPQYDYNMNFQL